MKYSNQTSQDIYFAIFLWRQLKAESQFTLDDQRVMTILSTGHLSENSESRCSGIKILIEGMSYAGDVVFGDESVVCDDSVVLQVVLGKGQRICYMNGNLIPQFIIPVAPELMELYKNLIAESRSHNCAYFMADMESCHLAHFMSNLLYDRLMHKYNEVMEIHKESDLNWNQTFYVMLFRAMGSPYNKAPFVEIAKRVPYNVVAHERGSLEMVEALLYGTSGLLQSRDDFYEYIKDMRSNFSHLQVKYDLKPLRAGAWKLYNNDFKGRPVTRLMQTAAFLQQSNFVFDNVIGINEAKDIYKLFDVETSKFWRDSPHAPQKIGKDRQEVLGINFVVPVMFAYGKSIEDEQICEKALELLYKIPVEKNIIVKNWASRGVPVESSADSQALIELENEFCKKGRCAECRFGMEQIRLKLVSLSK